MGQASQGAMLTMADHTRRAVESLRKGDLLLGSDDAACELLEDPISRVQQTVECISNGGLRTKVGILHTFMAESGGYHFAGAAHDRQVCCEDGMHVVVSVEDQGKDTVYELLTGGNHSFLCDGFWSLM